MKQNYSIQENYKLITMKFVNDKLIASLKLKFILLFFVLFSFNTNAQTRSEFSLADIAEPNSELEFFVVKSSLNITAKEFISDYLSVLNLVSNSEMRFVKSHTNEIGIQSSKYQQYVNGYKVIGGEMLIHEQNGRIKYVNGRYMTKQPLNSQVNLSEQTALDLALNNINSKEYLWLNLEAEAAFKKTKKDPNATLFPKGELLFTSNSSSSQQDPQFNLCWEYAINVTPQTESYKVYIDATTGELIKKLPLVYACSTGTCSTLWDGSQSINTSWTGSTFNCIDDCISAQIHTLNGNGNNNGVGATNYTDANNTWPSTQLGKYIGQAHWSMRKTRDYYVNIHAWNGVDDLGHDYISYLNPGFANNAYYSSSTETFSFGGNSDGTSPIISVDIVGHEATHGVIDFNSDLVYEKESGALNESFADIFGETIEFYTLGTHDWLIGAEIGYLRSFINPNVKNDPDTYDGTFYVATAGCVPAGGSGGNDFCGVHTNSGVQNFWYYLLTEGGSGTNDNGHAYNVTGIGITKARQIAFATLQNLTTTSGFSNARSVSIQAAKDLYGDCSDEVIQTTNAWRAVGVGSAYIAPLPLNITVSTTSVDVCKGGSITVTAFGASTYSWSNGQGTGNPKVITPSSTTTYIVIGTNAESCTGTKSFTLRVNQLPTVEPSVSDYEICAGQSTTLTPGSNQTINSFLTTLAGGNGLSGNAFDIHAYNSITITDFKMNISSGDSAEVWYNPGGYGNANITSNTGWTKLGATVPITAAGAGNLTTIPTTSNLTISAGSTYGIIVLCNGNNVYTNGTLVGSVESSNSDLYITEGHGGNGGFGAPLNFTLSPRVFNGTVEYKTNYTNYSWAPASTVSSPTSSSTIATPNSSTQYTLTATDGNGCTGAGIVKVYLYQNPSAGSITASPGSICSGETSQLNNFPFLSSSSQNLFTTLNNNNGNEGNVFDIHAINNITITNFRMHILSGDSAQVWYKTSPYGNTNVTSSTGWTKLGNTVAITAAGADALTLIPTTSNLVIPAGSTYGIAVVCNGTNRYLNGTSVGAVAFSSPDLEITEGHGGSGFNGAFIFVNVPRIFNGQIDYTVTNGPMNFLWSPNNALSSNNIQNPIADPHTTTNYTLTITDAHNCKDTIYKKLYVNPKPQLVMTNTQVLCPGDSAQLGFIADISEPDSLFTTLDNNNANGGNAFDIVTTKPINIKGFKMNLTGGTQVEIWYKSGGYGNANFTGTAGWTKLGSTINVVAAGAGTLTTVIPSTTLSLPAGATYGFMLVANGTVAYTDGLTAVGTTFVSNPDISIRVGHGGTGIGAYSFSSFPRVWNGEVVYDAINSLSSYLWSPNTNMNNAFIANPKVAPLSTTNYSVTVTDINGCTGNGVSGVVVAPLPQLGTATASPTSLCLGGNINLTYTQPAAVSCYGGYQGNFAGIYSPSNWTLALVNSNGSVNTALAPASITMSSSNGLFGSGQTNYSIAIPCDGIVTFNWEYNTSDGAQYDVPRYSINGINFFNFPGYQSSLGDPKQQIGTFTLAVTAGQTLTLQAYSTDNVGGGCTIKINGFEAPYQTFAGQTVVWYNAPNGGSNLGNGNPQLHTPGTSNTFTYYAQVSSTVTTCINPTRVATNSVVVNPIPGVGTTASASTICQGSSTTLTGTGATTYTWQPGGLSGTSVIVSPATTTTYTVTGTNAQGCSATATRVITVNPAPAVSGTASPGSVCPGGAVTLTGTNAGATFNWQPGNLNTASGVGVVVNPIAQTTYTVTATYGNGCSRSQTFVVLMNPTPTVSTSVAPSASFCAGSFATITATSLTATGYTWQPGGGVGANLIVTLANTYTVTATNSQGCTATATRVITVNSLPTVGTTVTNSTICSGATTSITGTGAVSYIWQPGGLTGTTINVSPATTTTYTVTGTNANGCVNTATRLITVNNSPTVGTNVTNATICAGNSTTITGTGASTYSWQPGGFAGNPLIVTPATTTTYTVTGTAANGCASTATRLITVNTANITATVITNPNICVGNSATIQASGGVSYVWQPGGMVTASINVSPIATTTYTVTGTAANGCTKTATATIAVGPTCTGSINIKLYLEGYYVGGGLMGNVLQNQAVAGATATQTDTITVELRNQTPPYTLANSINTILNTNGNASCNFTTTGTYYLVVKHRNGLETWSATPLTIASVSTPYDFTNAANKAYGSNQVNLGGGVFGFYVGDILKDENIDLLDQGILDLDISNFAFGYFATDMNGDGNVDILDSPIIENNVNNFVFSAHP